MQKRTNCGRSSAASADSVVKSSSSRRRQRWRRREIAPYYVKELSTDSEFFTTFRPRYAYACIWENFAVVSPNLTENFRRSVSDLARPTVTRSLSLSPPSVIIALISASLCRNAAINSTQLTTTLSGRERNPFEKLLRPCSLGSGLKERGVSPNSFILKPEKNKETDDDAKHLGRLWEEMQRKLHANKLKTESKIKTNGVNLGTFNRACRHNSDADGWVGRSTDCRNSPRCEQYIYLRLCR